MATEAVRPCSFAAGEGVLKTHRNRIAGRFQKAVRVRTPYARKIPEKTLLVEKRFLRKATEKKEQKIKSENHAPRKRGVIALAVSGEIFVKRVFSREWFFGRGYFGCSQITSVSRLCLRFEKQSNYSIRQSVRQLPAVFSCRKATNAPRRRS